MKKISLLLLTLTICFFTACHKDIWAELENLDQRVTKLEELCKEMNTNITSLQTIVSVLQSNDYITGIVEIKKNGEVIGYTITFGTHDPITIYNGEDGSSIAPIIGVAQDTDGIYYWTLNGEWLLDEDGNKLPVTGDDAQNGTMPQLKIEEGYWYVSYDSGATWTQLGKATGEDGKDGQDGTDGKDGQDGTDGKDGQDGDSMFQSVTEDDEYVYFTLSDGSVIKIPKGNGHQSSIGDGYVTSGIADGYYYVDLDLPSKTKWAICNIGSNRPEGPGYFFKWSKTTRIGVTDTSTLSSPPNVIYHTQYDAATINWGDNWAIPTKEHFEELLEFANWTYTTYNDIAGWKVSGPNGNSIFLPTIGYYNSTTSANYLFYSSSTSSFGEYVYCLCDYKYDAYADVKHIRKYPYVDMEMDYYKTTNVAENFRPFYTTDGYPIRPILVEED